VLLLLLLPHAASGGRCKTKMQSQGNAIRPPLVSPTTNADVQLSAL
jgi:hypothetical protein